MSENKKFNANVAFGYANQIYVSLVGILVLPIYLKLMGAEEFALVSFFGMLQAWMNLLDFGLTPTTARETAKFLGNVYTRKEFVVIYKSLNLIFLVLGVLSGALLYALSSDIATHWLNLKKLDVNQAIFAAQAIAIIVPLRWLSGVYRGVVSGAEQIHWLSLCNIVISTLRFIVVIGSMYLFGFTVDVFFMHQIVVVLAEVAVLYRKSVAIVPQDHTTFKDCFKKISELKQILRFSLTLGFTTSVWTVVTQLDKFILSGILPLAEYGYFSLAVTMANGVWLVNGPITTALVPRLTRLWAEKKEADFSKLYYDATKGVVSIAGTVAITMALCAKDVLFAWTGNVLSFSNAQIIIQLYAIGNAISVISAFAYYMQYAIGNVRLHLMGNAIFVILQIPMVYYGSVFFGGTGAAAVWVALNTLYLFIWVPIVFSSFRISEYKNWIFNCVVKVMALPIIISTLVYVMLPDAHSRPYALVNLGIIVLVCLGVNSSVRSYLIRGLVK